VTVALVPCATEAFEPTKTNAMISNTKSRAECVAEQTFNPKSYSNCPDLQGGIPDLPRRRIRLKPTLVKRNTYCFFAHIAFGMDARIVTTPQATANMLIEVNAAALTNGGKKKHLRVSALTALQKLKLASGIAKTAALDYLKSETEFSNFPLLRFVDFNLVGTPTYISIRPLPTKVLPNDSKVWRLAQSEADKLRGKNVSELLPSLLNQG
jgi:hypothetical protein